EAVLVAGADSRFGDYHLRVGERHMAVVDPAAGGLSSLTRLIRPRSCFRVDRSDSAKRIARGNQPGPDRTDTHSGLADYLRVSVDQSGDSRRAGRAPLHRENAHA